MSSTIEWLRCNRCFGKFKNSLQLTQCGHIYCHKCIKQAEKQCFQCGARDMMSLTLEPLPPNVAFYFDNTSEQLQKLSQSLDFQEVQKKIYLQKFDAMTTKYNALKEAYWQLNENLKKTMEKYQKLKISYMTTVQKNQASNQITPMPNRHFETPTKKISNSQIKENFSRSFFSQVTPNSNEANDGIFRVPLSRRVPRSAVSAGSAGYHTASSRISSVSSINSTPNNTPNFRYK